MGEIAGSTSVCVVLGGIIEVVAVGVAAVGVAAAADCRVLRSYPVELYNRKENCQKGLANCCFHFGRRVGLLSALQHIRQIQEASPLRTIRMVKLTILEAKVQQLPIKERNATVLSLESAFLYE
jgi:hypothetical protein